jgi:hypothetical protein
MLAQEFRFLLGFHRGGGGALFRVNGVNFNFVHSEKCSLVFQMVFQIFG